MSTNDQLELIAKEALIDLLVGKGRFNKVQLAKILGVSRPYLDSIITSPENMRGRS